MVYLMVFILLLIENIVKKIEKFADSHLRSSSIYIFFSYLLGEIFNYL